MEQLLRSLFSDHQSKNQTTPFNYIIISIITPSHCYKLFTLFIKTGRLSSVCLMFLISGIFYQKETKHSKRLHPLTALCVSSDPSLFFLPGLSVLDGYLFSLFVFSCQIKENRNCYDISHHPSSCHLSPHLLPLVLFSVKTMQNHCMQWSFWLALEKKFPSFSWKLKNSLGKLILMSCGDTKCQRKGRQREYTR